MSENYLTHACPTCGVKIESPAEKYLHGEVHLRHWQLEENPYGIARLPFSLFPAVAEAMEGYA